MECLWNELDRCFRNLPDQVHSKKDLWEKLQVGIGKSKNNIYYVIMSFQ